VACGVRVEEGAGFLKPECGIQEIWKSRRGAGLERLFSHQSHRRGKRGCGCKVNCVDDARRRLAGLGLKALINSQRARIALEPRQRGVGGVGNKCGANSWEGSAGRGFPIQHGARWDVLMHMTVYGTFSLDFL
jgi:hypothetical protein